MEALFRLVVTLSLTASYVFAGAEFTEVANARNLNHTTSYGATFPELSSSTAMLQRNMGNGVAIGDYDRDGDLDIFLASQLGISNRLFRNELNTGSKTFTDVSVAAGVASDGFTRMANVEIEVSDRGADGGLLLITEAVPNLTVNLPPRGVRLPATAWTTNLFKTVPKISS